MNCGMIIAGVQRSKGAEVKQLTYSKTFTPAPYLPCSPAIVNSQSEIIERVISQNYLPPIA
jgi:hypothetical protein